MLTGIHLTRYAYKQRGQVRQRSTFPGEPASASRSGPMTATAGPDNQLLTVNGAAQTYDLRGNLRKGVLPSGTMGSLAETYTFDARNRLTAMEGGHRFAYDVANNRIGITDGTSTTDFYLFSLGGLSQVVSEKTTTSGSDAASYERFYIYTPQGQLLYHLDPDMAGDISSTTRFKAGHYHYDLTGSTVALSGDDGQVKGRVFYTPYGEVTHRDAAVDTRFLFCGAYGVQTDANGLVYMRARYYHPYLARFLNEDPIEFDGGMNWYAYVNGNPLNLVDPSGTIGSGIVPTANGWVNGWTGESGTYTGLQMPTIFDHLSPSIGGIPGNSKVNNVEWMRQRFPDEINFAEASVNFQIRNNIPTDAFNIQPNDSSFQGWIEGYEYGNMWIRVRNIQSYGDGEWKAEMYVTDGLGFDNGDSATMWWERNVQGEYLQRLAPSRSIERGSWEIRGKYRSQSGSENGK